MITPAGLKNFRTTLLGHMPGWCPDIHAVGPWRPISIVRRNPVSIDNVSIRAVLEESGVGRLSVSLHSNAEDPAMLLHCGGMEQPFEKVGDSHYSAILKLFDIDPWWPHTHGAPRLYELTLVSDGVEYPLGRTGFRRIDVDRGADGDDFALLVNGERIFCRGAVWTTADIARLPGERADYEPFLRLAAAAGMNMIRIGGTMAYETPDFFALCDELGLLVWQDFMFANFDYPRNDKAFLGHVHAEVEEFLHGVQASPSLAVLCGGSEIHQQAAMLGLPAEFWSGPVTDEIIPAVVARMRPDVPYVPNSPYGGAMPFSPNAGIAHYYGVGAYMRPIADARRADVRFASESLAFAHVPQQRTLQRHLDVPAVHSPLWKARVPRDRSASWDFEDVRDFYLQLLYGFDPAELRREDPERYLDLSRAVTGEVIEETLPNGGARAPPATARSSGRCKTCCPARLGGDRFHRRAEARLVCDAPCIPAGSGGLHRRGNERSRRACRQRDGCRARCRARGCLPARRKTAGRQRQQGLQAGGKRHGAPCLHRAVRRLLRYDLCLPFRAAGA